MKQLGLRTQLTLIYTAVFGILFLGLGTLFYHTLATRLDRSLNEELDERAAALRGYIRFREGIPTLVYNQGDPEVAHFIHEATRYYQVVDLTKGTLIVQSRDLQLLRVQPSPEKIRGLASGSFSEIQTSDGHIRFHNYVVRNNGSGEYLIQVGSSLQPVESALRQLMGTTLLLTPVGAMLAALCGWWMARRAIRPLNVLAKASREIEISGLHRRLPVRGTGDELDRLSAAFNEALARLQRSVEQMKQFTAAISHELRTPLTALRGEAEVALLEPRASEEYQRILADQLEEFDKLTRMISRLLVLARADAGEIQLSLAPVDLSELVDSLVEQMEPVASAKEVQLQTSIEGSIELEGDREWLERAVLNVLDNAIKFTPPGGQVTVSVKHEDESAHLEVLDTGIGISPDALPHIFDRFYRADPSRSRLIEGVGLGLNLVKWIVDQHNGRIIVQSRDEGGTSITILLPIANLKSAAI